MDTRITRKQVNRFLLVTGLFIAGCVWSFKGGHDIALSNIDNTNLLDVCPHVQSALKDMNAFLAKDIAVREKLIEQEKIHEKENAEQCKTE